MRRWGPDERLEWVAGVVGLAVVVHAVGEEHDRVDAARVVGGQLLLVGRLGSGVERRAVERHEVADAGAQRLPDVADATRLDQRQEVLVLLVSEVRSEEHTSELQSLMRISYAVFCLQK